MKASTLGLVTVLSLASQQNDARAAELEGRFTQTVGVASNPSLNESGDAVGAVLTESLGELELNLGGSDAVHTSSLEGTAGAQWAPGQTALNKLTGSVKGGTVINEDGNLGINVEAGLQRKERAATWLPEGAPYVQTDEASGEAHVQVHPGGEDAILSGELGVSMNHAGHTFGMEGQNHTQATVWEPQAQMGYGLFPRTDLLCEGGMQILRPGVSTLPVEAAQAWSAVCGVDTLLSSEIDRNSGFTFRVGAGELNRSEENSQPSVLGAVGGQLRVAGFTVKGGVTRYIEDLYPMPRLSVSNTWTAEVEWQGPADRLKVAAQGGQRWHGGTASTKGQFNAAYRIGDGLDVGASAEWVNHEGAQNTSLRVGVVVVPLGR